MNDGQQPFIRDVQGSELRELSLFFVTDHRIAFGLCSALLWTRTDSSRTTYVPQPANL